MTTNNTLTKILRTLPDEYRIPINDVDSLETIRTSVWTYDHSDLREKEFTEVY